MVKKLAEDIGLNLTLPHRARGKQYQTDGWIEGYGVGILSEESYTYQSLP